MRTVGRQRWLVLIALLTLALTAAAWVRETSDPLNGDVVEALVRSDGETQVAAAVPPSDRVALDKLRAYRLNVSEGDPFGPRSWSRAARAKSAAQPVTLPSASPAAVAPTLAAPAPPRPSAPPLPFIYLGRIVSEEANAVFLVQGERNLIVRVGDEIDATYRIEQLADNAVTMTHLPTGIQQSLSIRGNP